MKYLLMIVLLFSSGQARAEQGEAFYTGNELLELCEAYLSGDTVAIITIGNTCIGYVIGIADAQKIFVNRNLMEQNWCLPEDIKASQLVRVVTKYLQENPQALHLTASSMAANALQKAFHCE